MFISYSKKKNKVQIRSDSHLLPIHPPGHHGRKDGQRTSQDVSKGQAWKYLILLLLVLCCLAPYHVAQLLTARVSGKWSLCVTKKWNQQEHTAMPIKYHFYSGSPCVENLMDLKTWEWTNILTTLITWISFLNTLLSIFLMGALLIKIYRSWLAWSPHCTHLNYNFLPGHIHSRKFDLQLLSLPQTIRQLSLLCHGSIWQFLGFCRSSWDPQ